MKEHDSSSARATSPSLPSLLHLVVLVVLLGGSFVVADRSSSRHLIAAFLSSPPSTIAPGVGVRPSSSSSSSSPPSTSPCPGRGGGPRRGTTSTTIMTMAFPKPRPTVAELEAESEVLRAEIEEMRAEALRRLGELRERLTGTTTTTTTESATVSSTKPGGTTLIEYLDSTEEDGPIVSPPVATSTTTVTTKNDPLDGTRWRVSLDVGREPGTWMPAEWGRSGKRINLSFVAEFAPSISYDRDDMVLRVVDGIATLGPSVSEGRRSYAVRDGGWRVARGEGPMGTDILRFYVEVVDDRIMHADGDVYLPGGRVYCSCGYFPFFPGNVKDLSTSSSSFSASSSLNSAREALIGELMNIEERMTKLKKKKDGIRNPFDLDGIKISSELSRLKREARIVNGKLNFKAVTEPDPRLLRFSKDGDIGLTKEGGVCCQVNKGPIVEYHILGRFSIASVDRD
ncbi:hypothetical protein ACHAXA_005571 [Cyclostephanos tholiformis]|uniref:Uncharacterized protein n=1 Tax=Cyclostephanos tholiformis TaxID=382380 RepID=A0ABD3SGK5_9STRA